MSLILLRREGETLVQLLTRLDYLLREGPQFARYTSTRILVILQSV